MTNVVNLGGKSAAESGEPNVPVIGAIEELLTAAKDGRIQHLACVFTDGKAPPSDLYVGSGEVWHVMALIGGLELCKHTLLMSQYQESMRHTDFT